MKHIYFRMLFLIITTSGSSMAEDLKTGYNKLLALSLTDDISASKLKSDGLSYEKYSLPYNFNELYVNGDYSFSVQLRGNYLKVKSSSFHIENVGSLHARWDIFSITTSPKVTYKINDNFSFENELEFGYANMKNNSSFHGDFQMKESLREEKLLDWDINSFHITPKVGIKNTFKLNNNYEVNSFGRISYMFANGFRDKNNTGTWALGSEYVMTDLFKLNEKNFNLILSDSIGGFYGKNYRELSFGVINNISLSLEAPIDFYDDQLKIKMGVGYLLGDNAHGITFILEIR